ncbi:MAG: sensor histidine kinase [Saprospiraceae bacterium]|nr:sensor histidine kinase [Saprospiraceae bacterium]
MELANSDRQIAELRLDNASYRNTLLIILIILAIGLIFYFFKLGQKIRKQNYQISLALTEKETLLKEIHHRVKNNLQVISSLLSLQSKSEDDPNVVSALKLGQDRVRSMALIHQNLYEEDNLTGIEIKIYFEKLIQSLFHSYNISPERIALQMNIEDLHLDVESVIPLGLIVNELITNSLKYAFPKEKTGIITISLQENQNNLHLQVMDDGIGFDQTDQKMMGKSFGFRLINVFKLQLKANMHIDSSNGTTVDMHIKEYKRVS